MITNLFYYDVYKPYIIEDLHSKKIKMPSSKDFILSSQNGIQKFSYFLNKSSKKEIISYITQVSNNFNNLKSTSHYLALRLNNNLSIKNGIENSSKQINTFVKGYNQFLEFYNTNENAKINFYSYINSLQDIIYENKDILSKVGISIDKNNKLNIEESLTSKLLLDCNSNVLNNLKYVYDLIYQRTCDYMKSPLTDCMNFKNLSYYFNYSLYNNPNKTFPLIEGGLLVNIMAG